jgi:hypothetical protein
MALPGSQEFLRDKAIFRARDPHRVAIRASWSPIEGIELFGEGSGQVPLTLDDLKPGFQLGIQGRF